jgi:hypothetical protein
MKIQSIRFNVNEQKSKYMIVSTSEVRRRPQYLLVGEEDFEVVPSFNYLGAVMNNGNDMGQSIRDRIQAGKRSREHWYALL